MAFRKRFGPSDSSWKQPTESEIVIPEHRITQVITIDEVAFDTLEESTFELPPEIREKLGLTLDDVEKWSRRIVETRQIPEYLFTAGRLCQVERGYSLPSIYKFASLSVIYRTPFAELLRIYGIETARVRRRPSSNKIRVDGRGETNKPETTPREREPTPNLG